MRVGLQGTVGAALVALGAALAITWWLPPYGDYSPKAKVSEVLLGMVGARDQIASFYRKHQRLPRDAAEVPLDERGSSERIRSLSYDGASGELRAVAQGAPEIEGKVLKLRAYQVGGELP